MAALHTAREFIARMHWHSEERRNELIEGFEAKTYTEQDALEIAEGLPQVIEEWEAELVRDLLNRK